MADPTILGHIPAETAAFANATDGTNIGGQASDTGDHAVIWSVAAPTDAPTILGAHGTYTTAPNVTGIDGDYAVGSAFTPGFTLARGLLWSVASPASAPIVLGSIAGLTTNQRANGVSGSRIVGSGNTASGRVAVMWDATSPLTAGVILGAFVGQTDAVAYAVSGDRIVGEGSDADTTYALLWDATSPATAPTFLGVPVGFVQGSDYFAFAYGVSADWIVGAFEGLPDFDDLGLLWDATNPTAAPAILGLVLGGTTNLGNGVSGDQIVGYSDDDAVLWDAANPTSAPTVLEPGPSPSFALAVGISGSVAVGAYYSGQYYALMWSAAPPPPPGPILGLVLAGSEMYLSAPFRLGPIGESLIRIEVSAPGIARARIKLYDPTNSITVSDNDTIVIYDQSVSANAFQGTVQTRKLEIVANYRWWDINAVDLNAWLDLILVGVPDGTEFLEDPPGEFTPYDSSAVSQASDSATVQWLFDTYASFLGLDVTTYVETLAPNLAATPIRWNEVTLRSALTDLAALASPYLRFWIDQEAAFHWTVQTLNPVVVSGDAVGPLLRMFPFPAAGGSIAGAVFTDTFTRVEPSGWGTSTSGTAWQQLGGGTASVNGSAGLLQAQIGFGISMEADAVGGASGGFDYLVKFSWVLVGTDYMFLRVYAFEDYGAGDTYSVELQRLGGVNTLFIDTPDSGGVTVTLGAGALASATNWGFRIQAVSATYFRAHLWNTSGSEPTTWDYTGSFAPPNDAGLSWGIGLSWDPSDKTISVDEVAFTGTGSTGGTLIALTDGVSDGVTSFNYENLSLEYDDSGWADLIYVSGATTYTRSRTYTVRYLGGGLFQGWTGTDHIYGDVFPTPSNLTVRTTASDSSASLGTLIVGTVVVTTGYNASGGSYTFSGTRTDWYSITYKSQTAWIHAHGTSPYNNAGLVTGAEFTCDGLLQSKLTPATATPIWKLAWSTAAVQYPVGARYDPSNTAVLWVVDGFYATLSQIQRSNRAVLSTTYIGKSLPYPLGLSSDPNDTSIYWVLNAPWRYGGTATGSYFAKVRASDNTVLATHSLPSQRWTDMKVSGSFIWLSNFDTDQIHKYSKTTFTEDTAYTISYEGTAQVNPTGLYVDTDGAVTTLGYFFLGKARFLLADETAPTTITGIQSTAGTQIEGGEMNSTTHIELFSLSDTAHRTWAFNLQVTTPAYTTNYYVIQQPGGTFDRYWLPTDTYRSLLLATIYDDEIGGSGWVQDQTPETTTVASPRQRLLQAYNSDTQTTRDNIGGTALAAAGQAVVRGSCVIYVNVGGWVPGQALAVTSAPAELDAARFMTQKTITTFISGRGDRAVALEFGNASLGNLGLRRAAQIAPGTKARRPALRMEVLPSNRNPGPNGTVRVTAQCVDQSGNAWPIVGKTVVWSIAIYDTNGNEVTPVVDYTFDPTTSTTNVYGQAWTELTVGDQEGLSYYVTATAST